MPPEQTPPPSPPVPPVPAPQSAPAVPQPVPEGVALIGFEDFQKVKLVTATVAEARPHANADRLLVLQVQVGERRKQIVSGIREFYQPEALLGRTLILVDNLKPAKLRGEVSEGMLLAARLPEGGLRLLTTDGPAPSGLPIS